MPQTNLQLWTSDPGLVNILTWILEQTFLIKLIVDAFGSRLGCAASSRDMFCDYGTKRTVFSGGY